jgi:HK97 family phage major capsid protein
MRIKEIEERKAEIKALLEGTEQVDLDALQTELRQLSEEKSEIEKRQEISKAVELGTVEVKQIEKPQEEKIMEQKTKEEVLNSAEYRNAFLKMLQGQPLSEVEQRNYDSGAGSAGAAIPTQTSETLFAKMTKLAPMLSEITLLRVAGNVQFATEGVRNAAYLHAQNAAITAATDTLVKVSLTGYEYNKLLYVSKTVQTMAINAFEGWLTDMIAEDIAVAIEDAIINGSGSTQPKGLANATTFSTTTNLVEVTGTFTITYQNVLDVIAKLPARYDSNAKFLANKGMVYQGLAAVKDTNGRPILVNDATGDYPFKVLGFPVIVSDKVTNKTLFFGDYKKIVGNLSQDVTVERDMSAGFASNSIAYRGGAIFDCNIALADAFVKLTTFTY